MVTIPGGKLLALTQLTFFISPGKHDICKQASQILQLKNTVSYVYRGKDGPNRLISKYSHNMPFCFHRIYHMIGGK